MEWNLNLKLGSEFEYTTQMECTEFLWYLLCFNRVLGLVRLRGPRWSCFCGFNEKTTMWFGDFAKRAESGKRGPRVVVGGSLLRGNQVESRGRAARMGRIGPSPGGYPPWNCRPAGVFFLAVSLRYHWHTALFRDLTCIYCKIITTISLVSIHHLKELHFTFFFLVMTTLKIYS